MKKKQKLILLFLGLTLNSILFGTWEPQTESEKRGYQIALKSKELNKGWLNSTNDLQMVLINDKNEKKIREIRSKNLEVKADGDKSLSIFDNPKDIKGTAFLTFSHLDKADDQWIYLPALKRVKRISTKSRSGSFMGSEFAYEDLSSFEVEKYTYDYIAQETIEGQKAFKVKYIPLDKNSGYKFFYSWLSADHYQPLQTQYYDRKGSLLKTLNFIDYKQYGKFWRADQMQMFNHQKNRETILYFKNYKFNVNLEDKDFNSRKLKSIR